MSRPPQFLIDAWKKSAAASPQWAADQIADGWEMSALLRQELADLRRNVIASSDELIDRLQREIPKGVSVVFTSSPFTMEAQMEVKLYTPSGDLWVTCYGVDLRETLETALEFVKKEGKP